MTFPHYCTPVVSRLLSLVVKGVEEDPIWLEKAIKSLSKKLRKTQQLEEFEKIILSKNPLSQCITITRSLDGRLQIAHRKVLPHVAYCKLFRWPDLHSYHELKSLGKCEFSFQKKKDLLCINPYHYYRAELLIMPPVYVPKQKQSSGFKGQIDEQYLNGFGNLSCSYNMLETAQMDVLSDCINSNHMPNKIGKFDCGEADFCLNGIVDASPFQTPIMAPMSLIYGLRTENVTDPIVNLIPSNYNNLNANNLSNLNAVTLFKSIQNSTTDSPPTVDMRFNFEPTNHDVKEVSQIQIEIDKLVAESILPVLKKHLSIGNLRCDRNEDNLKETHKIINYEPCKFWCSINYYEFAEKVGKSFTSNAKIINIDFNSDVSNQSYLGLKSFKLLSNQNIDNLYVRNVGNVLRLIHGGGEVMIECLTKNMAIFVCSANFNAKNKKPIDYVHQLERGDIITLFDYHDFSPLLSKCILHSYEAVYKLLSWTIVRISFIKGWGLNFKRKNPDNTPFWLEIKLTGPMTWLDRIICQLVAPSSNCSSIT